MICYPKHTPEGQALIQAVGTFEATRDWMEHNNTVRTPEEVLSGLGDQGVITYNRTPLQNVFGNYNANTQGFFPKEINPDQLKSDLVKAGFPSFKVNKTSTGGYWISDGGKVVTAFYRAPNESTSTLFGDISKSNAQLHHEKLIDLDSAGLTRAQLDQLREQEAHDRLADVPVITQELNQARSEDNLDKITDQFTARFQGVQSAWITPEQAPEKTRNASNKWNGEPAFFGSDGVIYFVKGLVTPDMILHEFSHPIFRSMWMTPESLPLFTKLYEDLSGTSEGQAIIATVERDYAKDYPKDSNFFKEEVLVRALTTRAENLRNQTPETKEFSSWISKILYHIKQFFRKIFKGPIRPEKLDVNTTLDDLAKMLVNDDFKIDAKLVTQDQIVSYMKKNREFLDELSQAKTLEKIQPLLSKLYSTTFSTKVTALEKLPEMLSLIQGEFVPNLLNNIRNDVYKYKDLITSKIDELNTQSKAFFSALYHLDTITDQMLTEMLTLKDAPGTPENVIRVQSIKEFTKAWDNFLNNPSGAYTVLSYSLPKDSQLMNLMSKINRQISGINSHADPIIKEGMEVLLTDVLKDMSDTNDKLYQSQIENLQKKGAKPETIKKVKDEYEKVRITPGLIKSILSGLKGDAGPLNSMLEGWLYNTDKVVGGMGVFFKNTYNTIQTIVQSKFVNFVDSVVPLAKEAGVTLTSNVADFSKKFLFVDSKPVWENGELTKHEVYTYLNLHKDYRWEVADLNNKLQKAKEAFEKTQDPADEILYTQLKADKEEQDKHFYRQYIDEFYDKNILSKSPIGLKAQEQRDNIYEQINDLTKSVETEGDLLDVRPGDLNSPAQQIEELYKQIRQLYSLKDLDDNYKTGEPLEIAKILQQSRDINRLYYDYTEVPGKFQKLLSRYEQELVDSGLSTDSKEFQDKRQQWLDHNTVQSVSPEFYSITGPIYDNIRKIYESASKPSPEALELAKTYKEISDVLYGYRDSDGQPIGSDMSPKTIEKLKTLQERAEVLKKEVRSGMSEAEQEELSGYYDLLRNKTRLDPEQQERFDELSVKGDSSGLTRVQKAALNGYFRQLSDLEGKEPTEYYLDVFNHYLSKLPEDLKERLADVNKVPYIDKNSADFVINLPKKILLDVLQSVPGFEAWFRANHIKVDRWNSSTNKVDIDWQRVSAWTIKRPLDPAFMVHTKVYDLDGKGTTDIQGKPSQRFYKRTVKEEYLTPRIPGVTVSPLDINAKSFKGLPKSTAEGAPSDRFINQEYLRIQREDPKLFKALEEIKSQHLSWQQGVDRYAQLGYDFPMLRKHTSESITSGGNPLSTWWDNTKAFFTRAKDDPDSGYNLRDEIDLTKEGYFDTTPKDRVIPVSGIYNLPLQDVSLDLFHAQAQYLSGLERQKGLTKILPFFNATHDVLTDPANTIRTTDDVQTKNLLGRLGGKNTRAAALYNKMEREFYGQTNTGVFANNKGVNAVINAAFKGASISYLAVQFPSAIANMSVQITQNIIRSASGEQFNPAELIQGSIWAGKASVAVMNEIHNEGSHSLTVQLCEIFDPIPGSYSQKIGTTQGRSYLRDFVSLSWLYSPRKFMENYATLEAFGAMMNHVKVKQDDQEIKYINAWYLKDGKITLKPGIDETYAQGNREFNKILNYMQHVQHDMNGAYDNFAQPEAQRYILYRMYSFLRRYVTTMLTNRFAPTRNIPGMMQARTGFYTSTAKTLYRTLLDPKYFKGMNETEKAAARQFATEIGLIALMFLMYGLFGWDPDDPDKYEKLREKSGPLPLPFVTPTSDEFHIDGWLSNHMLLQLLKLKSQTEMWVPLPGMGLKDFTSLPSAVPIAVGPTVDSYAKIIDNLIRLSAGDTHAYYQRTVGPYDWQQEGNPKLFNYLGQITGLRGATITPELAIQKQEQAKVLK